MERNEINIANVSKMNWRQRIHLMMEMEEFGTLTDAEAEAIDFIGQESSCWVTCACGEKEDFLKAKAYIGHSEDQQESPQDNFLLKFGQDFNHEVVMGYWYDALMTLDDIDRRSAILIKELAIDPSPLLPEYRVILDNYIKNRRNGKLEEKP